jgi:hypothetical protein
MLSTLRDTEALDNATIVHNHNWSQSPREEVLSHHTAIVRGGDMANTSGKPKKRVLVSYGVDIDAIAGWLGSYKGEDSTSDVSRGKLSSSIPWATRN